MQVSIAAEETHAAQGPVRPRHHHGRDGGPDPHPLPGPGESGGPREGGWGDGCLEDYMARHLHLQCCTYQTTPMNPTHLQ